jgi:hypothetical protein
VVEEVAGADALGYQLDQVARQQCRPRLTRRSGGATLDRQMGFLSLRAFRKSQFTPVPHIHREPIILSVLLFLSKLRNKLRLSKIFYH